VAEKWTGQVPALGGLQLGTGWLGLGLQPKGGSPVTPMSFIWGNWERTPEHPIAELERLGRKDDLLALFRKRGEVISTGAERTKEPGLKVAYEDYVKNAVSDLKYAETKSDYADIANALRTISPEAAGVSRDTWRELIQATEKKMALAPEKTATQAQLESTNPINEVLQGIGVTIGRAPGALAAGLGSGLTAGFMGGSGSKGAGINWSAILGVAVIGGSLYYLLKSKAGAEDKVKKAVTA